VSTPNEFDVPSPDGIVMCAVPEGMLTKTTGQVDNDNELTNWVEYRLPGSDIIVHRSAHVTLKKGDSVTALLGTVGG